MKKLIAVLLIVSLTFSSFYIQRTEVKANATVALEFAKVLLTWVATAELIKIATNEDMIDKFVDYAETTLKPVADLWDQVDLQHYKDDKNGIMNNYHETASNLYGSYTKEYYEYLKGTHFHIYPITLRQDRYENFVRYEKKIGDEFLKEDAIIQEPIAYELGSSIASDWMSEKLKEDGIEVSPNEVLNMNNLNNYFLLTVVGAVITIVHLSSNDKTTIDVSEIDETVKAVAGGGSSSSFEANMFAQWYKQNVMYDSELEQYRFTTQVYSNVEKKYVPYYHYADTLNAGYQYVPAQFKDMFSRYVIEWGKTFINLMHGAKVDGGYVGTAYSEASGAFVSGLEIIEQPVFVKNLFGGYNVIIARWHYTDPSDDYLRVFIFDGAVNCYVDVVPFDDVATRTVYYFDNSELDSSCFANETPLYGVIAYNREPLGQLLGMSEIYLDEHNNLYEQWGYTYGFDNWGREMTIDLTTVDIRNFNGDIVYPQSSPQGVYKPGLISGIAIGPPVVDDTGNVSTPVATSVEYNVNEDDEGVVTYTPVETSDTDYGDSLVGDSDFVDSEDDPNAEVLDAQTGLLQDLVNGQTTISDILKGLAADTTIPDILSEINENVKAKSETAEESIEANPITATGTGGLPFSIPNLFALLGLILIQILLLFVKGFVIVGLIFKIPATTTLFNADVIDAIERTRVIQLGRFNMTIVEMISWLVAFIFTFMLLKTLNSHLKKFNVV